MFPSNIITSFVTSELFISLFAFTFVCGVISYVLRLFKNV